MGDETIELYLRSQGWRGRFSMEKSSKPRTSFLSISRLSFGRRSSAEASEADRRQQVRKSSSVRSFESRSLRGQGKKEQSSKDASEQWERKKQSNEEKVPKQLTKRQSETSQALARDENAKSTGSIDPRRVNRLKSMTSESDSDNCATSKKSEDDQSLVGRITAPTSRKRMKQRRTERIDIQELPDYKLLSGNRWNWSRCHTYFRAIQQFRFVKPFICFFMREKRLCANALFLQNGSRDRVDKIMKALKILEQQHKFIFPTQNTTIVLKRQEIPADFDPLQMILDCEDYDIYDLASVFKKLLMSASVPLLNTKTQHRLISIYRSFRKRSLTSKKDLRSQLSTFEKKVLDTLKRLPWPNYQMCCYLLLFLRELVNNETKELGYVHDLALVFAPIFFRNVEPSLTENLLSGLEDQMNVLLFLIDSCCVLPVNCLEKKTEKGTQIVIDGSETTSRYPSIIQGRVQSEEDHTDYHFKVRIGLYKGQVVPLSRVFMDSISHLQDNIKSVSTLVESEDVPAVSGKKLRNSSYSMESSLHSPLNEVEKWRVEMNIKHRFFELGPVNLFEELDISPEVECLKVLEVLKVFLACVSSKLVSRSMYDKQLKYIQLNHAQKRLSWSKTKHAVNVFVLDMHGARNRAYLCVVLDLFLRMLHVSENKTALLKKIGASFVDVMIDYPTGEREKAAQILQFLIGVYNRVKRHYLKLPDFKHLFSVEETFSSKQEKGLRSVSRTTARVLTHVGENAEML